eukprot:GHVU01218223.1.p1 GENE.GHVU01218223.1~~GHVU01218223.1.p1  ORF type:complete len:121 (-),score=2.50 GHVU01218223.1:78-440(-)
MIVIVEPFLGFEYLEFVILDFVVYQTDFVVNQLGDAIYELSKHLCIACMLHVYIYCMFAYELAVVRDMCTKIIVVPGFFHGEEGIATSCKTDDAHVSRLNRVSGDAAKRAHRVGNKRVFV